MPLKVTYECLQNPQFLTTVQKLAGHPLKNFRVSYNLSRIKAKIEQEGKVAQEMFSKLLKSYAKLDEKGEFIPHEGKPNTFEVPKEKEVEFVKARQEFDAFEFEIERHPVKLSELQKENLMLSGAEIQAVEPLLDMADAEEFLEKGLQPDAPGNVIEVANRIPPSIAKNLKGPH